MKTWVVGGSVLGVLAVGIAIVAFLPEGNEEPRPSAEFRSGVERDIAAFLAQEASDEDLNDLFGLLTVQHSGRQGRDVLEGIWSIDADYHNHVLYVEMLPDTDDEGKLAIAGILDTDPRVERVEFDLVVDLSTD